MEPRWYTPVILTKLRLSYPVCKAVLGYRMGDEMFIGHCEECLATFTWYPQEDKPAAELDRDKRHKTCGCGACSK